MKVLSVRQPWADLIVSGPKDVENRARRSNYRGPLLFIHPSPMAGRLGIYDLPVEMESVVAAAIGEARERDA